MKTKEKNVLARTGKSSDLMLCTFVWSIFPFNLGEKLNWGEDCPTVPLGAKVGDWNFSMLVRTPYLIQKELI